MTIANETAYMDATAQAELVQRGELHPTELLEAAIERVERLNPELNAVVTPMFDLARKTAAGDIPGGPFRGVPFVLKDLLAQYAGVPMKSGSRLLESMVPREDSELVRRYKRAGLIILGKTNTPEFGFPPTTEALLYGPCRNPWNTEHSTGGSSGGSAAAVASGMVAMGHANDGGGSIRIPASCCGLFGLKPTRARNSLAPAFGDMQNGLVCEHAVTRTVRDSAALLDATEGPAPGDPYWAPPKERPYAQEVGAGPGKLRIALSTTSMMDAPVHDDCISAVQAAAKLCEDLGHSVEEATPPLDAQEVSRGFITLWAAGAAQTLDAIAETTGHQPTADDVEPLTWGLYEMGKATGASEYMNAVVTLQRVSRQIARFMQARDIWLTPTLAEPPLKLGTLDPEPGNPLAGFFRAGQYVPFTPICNATGQPAMSVPLHWNDAGLPIGTHFIAPFGDEATLFRLAAQLEEACPWSDRRPKISA